MIPTRELEQEKWARYLDDVSQEMLHAEVSVEVTGVTGGPYVEVDRLALHAVGYDRRDDVFEVAAVRGGPHLPSVVRHLVDHPSRIAVDSPWPMTATTIAVDDREGVRTLIRLARPAEFTG